MLDFNAWLSANVPIDAGERAVAAKRRIDDKPAPLVLKRGVTAIAEQVVRIEYGANLNEDEGEAGKSPSRRVNILGLRDHPTLPDFNVQSGDRFTYEARQYKITDVYDSLGERNAIGEAM